MPAKMDQQLDATLREERIAVSRAEAAKARFQAGQFKRATQVLAMQGSYTAARRSRMRTNGGARIRNASADAHRDPLTLQELRAGSQERERNDSSARSMVGRLCDMTIGDGYTVHAESEDPGWNKAVEDLHADWADRLDGTGADVRGLMTHDEQAVDCVRRACFDGDLLYLKLAGGSLQAIEATRLINPRDRLSNTQTMCNGVEMDAVGKPTTFHISDWMLDGSSITYQTTPRPADRCLYYVNPMQLTAGSTRGEPQLQAAVQRLERIGRYDVAVTAAAEMAACFGLIRKTASPGSAQAAWLGDDAGPGEGEAETQKEIDYRPGMTLDAGLNDTIEQIKPEQPTTVYGEFIMTQMMFAGTDLGLPLFLSMLDGRNVNLASMRAMMQIVFRSYHRWQRSVMTRLYKPTYLWKVAQWIRAGQIPFRTDWMKHSWTAPPPPMMDPLTEIEAGLAAVNARQKSPSRVAAELHGVNFPREVKKMAEDLKLLKEAGDAAGVDLSIMQKPGSKASGTASGSAAAPADPPPADGGDGAGGNQDGKGGV